MELVGGRPGDRRGPSLVHRRRRWWWWWWVLREEGGEGKQRRESRELERERGGSGYCFRVSGPRACPPFCSSLFFPFFWLNNIIQLIPDPVLVSG